MPGDCALLAPLDRHNAIELSATLWRKQLLPMGTIDYKGRKINFDKGYLTDLAEAYKAQAFDQVAFLLAKDDNSHTMDPERFRGEVRGVEVTPSGLDVLLDLTPDAAELVKKNPKLGVSARIIEGLERADGQKFPRAIQHVLGTLDPRVTGMASWQEVSLSEEVGDTVDVTNEEVKMTVQGEPMVVHNAPPPNTVPGAPDLDALTQDALDYDAGTLEDLAGSEGTPVELNNSVDLAARHEIEALQLDLARQKFINEMRVWIDKGVPPHIVQLARPILELPQAPVIDLSNHGGERIDVGKVVRDMLHETEGFIQLAQIRGDASGFEGNSEEQVADSLLTAWRNQ